MGPGTQACARARLERTADLSQEGEECGRGWGGDGSAGPMAAVARLRRVSVQRTASELGARR